MRQLPLVLVHILLVGGHKGIGQETFKILHQLPFLEFYPIVVAIHCWASLLSNRRVKFHTDNIAVVHIINKQSSHCPKIMHLLRLFVLQCLKFNIYLMT